MNAIGGADPRICEEERGHFSPLARDYPAPALGRPLVRRLWRPRPRECARRLFGNELLIRWIGEHALPSMRLGISGLVASLSLIIGALGASFEPYGYFRHVTQIEDEI